MAKMMMRERWLAVALGVGSLVLLTGCGGGGGVDGLLERLESTAERSPWLAVLILALATVTSEDVACVTAGVLAAQGTFSYPLAVTGCFLGIIISDVGLFLLGRWLGEPIVKYPPFRWFVTPARMKLGKDLYEHYGGALVIASRFLPGTRIVAYIAAGMLRYPWKRFILFMAIAVSIWTPALVGFSMLFGGAILDWMKRYQHWAVIGIPLAIVAVLLILKGMFRLTERLSKKRLKKSS